MCLCVSQFVCVYTKIHKHLLYNSGMIFYINHFSLIMFYHSVSLGFELFGS